MRPEFQPATPVFGKKPRNLLCGTSTDILSRVISSLLVLDFKKVLYFLKIVFCHLRTKISVDLFYHVQRYSYTKFSRDCQDF